MPIIRTKDVMASLPLVASILGDRYGVTVNIGGKQAYTNGKTINLPTLPLNCNNTLLALAKGYCDHEAAHIRHTDFEVLRAAHLTPMQKHLWNTIEDYVVEKKLAVLFPGCRQHFRWLIQHHFGTDEHKAGDTSSTTVLPALAILDWVLLTVRAWELPDILPRCEQVATKVHQTYPGLLPRLGAVLTRVRQRCRNTKEAIDYALELAAVIEEYAQNPPVQEESGTSLPKMKNTSSDSEAQTIGVVTVQNLKDILTATEQELPRHLGEQLAEILSLHHDPGRHSVGVAQEGHKPHFPLADPIKAEALASSVALRVRLHGLLQTKTRHSCIPGRQGKLNPQRLHGVAVNNPRVFVKWGERQGLSTAVHLLLDVSGSMHGTRMNLAIRACYAVAAALNRCTGVNLGVTVFPASPAPDGNENTVAPLIRHGERFHDRFSLCSGGETPLAQALWWVMQRMYPLQETRKLVCILSDGQPDSAQAAQSTLKQAQEFGFEVMGIGIQNSSLSELLSPLNMPSRTIHDLPDLAPAMFDMLQNALLTPTRR